MRMFFIAATTAAVAAAAGAAAADVVITPTEAVEMSRTQLIQASLTGEPGDGYRGVQTFIDESAGNCTGCHYNPDVEGTGQKGDVGPALVLVGDENPEARLRAILVNAPAVFGEDTAMPGYYVPDEDGNTLLTAQQIEDIVAYLGELQRYGN